MSNNENVNGSGKSGNNKYSSKHKYVYKPSTSQDKSRTDSNNSKLYYKY